jgi:hypothetical protein
MPLKFFHPGQVDKIMMVNAAHVRGSIQGIAGIDSVDLNLLEDNSTQNGEE